ncbi:MAG TPA: response regulator [Victivallales bacterium]|nr:response regulator [Victivallales bacterium]
MRFIDEATLSNINRMKIDMSLDLVYIFLLMLLVILVAIRFAYLIAKEIKGEVKSLIDLCDSGLKIQSAKLSETYSYEEFSIISKAIRAMSEQISGLLIELKTAAVKSSTAKQIQSGFLSSITHNLIGKLNNIMGIAQIIREKEIVKVGHDEPETDLFKLSDSIISFGKAMNTLLRDVSYVVAIDTDNFYFKKEVFTLDDFQKDVSKGVGLSSLSVKSINFIKTDTIPKQIKSERNLLKLIVTNLLEICGDSLKNKEVSIKISSLPEENQENRTKLEIRISIPQVGLTQSQLDEIENFPFVPREYATLGLRMAIARRLTEMIGGSLEVKLQSHSDLEAIIRIPVELSDESSIDLIQLQEKDLSKLSLKVLAVDDDAGSRHVITLMLKSIGVDVCVADSGAEALKLLEKRNDFDIVLMDCEMPDLNGYDTVIELRRRENEKPGSPHIPVIAMTGYTTPEDERRCLESGMDLFLPKPLMIEDLRKAILNALSKKK